MSTCDDCFKSVRHKGTPSGKVEKINGVETYIALPEGDYTKGTAILFLTDAFGMQYINNQLLADDFARNGFATYVPDYFSGDPFTEVLLSDVDARNVWFGKHGKEQTRPLLDAVIKGLQERGITNFGASGYCFGGRYVFDLAFEHIIKVSVTAHPSLLQIPADLEKYASTCSAPLLINSCEVDQQFSIASQALADQILGSGTSKPKYHRNYFEGCNHGFAVRGDMKDPKVKAGKEGAFKASVEWFKKHLSSSS